MPSPCRGALSLPNHTEGLPSDPHCSRLEHMFEAEAQRTRVSAPGSPAPVSTAEVAAVGEFSVAGLRAMRRQLAEFALQESTAEPDSRSTSPADAANTDRVDLLRELEELTGAISSAQARLSAELDAATRAERADRGIPADRQGAGVAAQVALARRASPVRGSQYLGLAKALVSEMPHTFAALAHGRLSEWRATLLVRESACLTVADREAFDAELCADPDRFASWGDKRFIAEARSLTARLDQEVLVRRAAKAEADRRVTIRPAPDTMAQITALLPVAQGVAVHAALLREADQQRARGDQRSKGQIMADTLVERVTGRASAACGPVEVQLVMTDGALLHGADDPAFVPGHGIVPAGWARKLVAQADAEHGSELGAWLRRLFTRPSSGQLVAMESRSRVAPRGLSQFITARDRTCRTPWCDAPIRHVDHVTPKGEGGHTEAENLQGLCEACNYTKEAAGWRSRAEPATAAEPHTVTVRTPTGHTYTSRPPHPPGQRQRQRRRVPGFVCLPMRTGPDGQVEVTARAA